MSFVTDLIDQAAAQHGVAAWVAEDIAQVESGLNPSAVGDNGTSFGLFQLHIGGQADGYSLGQLFDPATNADIGIANMAGAYNQGVAQGLTGFSLLDYTATNSGHPGYGGPGSAPDYEAKLAAAYNGPQASGNPGSVAIPSQMGWFGGGQPAAQPSDPITILDNALAIKNFNILHPGQSIAQDAGAIALRAFLFLIGVIVIIFGLLKLVK